MNTPERTIVFFTRYIPSMGGIENFTHSLATTLVNKNIDTIVITTDGEPGLQIEEGIETLRLPKIEMLDGRYPIPNLLLARKRIMECLDGRINAGLRVNIVINSRFYILSLMGASIAKQHGIKPILLDHSSSYITSSSKIVSTALKHADIFTTKLLNQFPINYYGVSQKSAHWLNNFGIKAKGVITNAIDAEAFVKQSSTKVFKVNGQKLVVSYAGRLIKEKGALKVAKLASRFPDEIEVFIAGSGPLAATVKQMSEEQKNLHFVGRLSHPDLSSLLIQTDIFCFPSTYGEGLPTCLLEAAACKCLLITTENGGTKEIIPDSDHGIVLKNAEYGEIEKTIKEILDDPQLINPIVQREFEHVSTNFSWEKVSSDLLLACSNNDSYKE